MVKKPFPFPKKRILLAEDNLDTQELMKDFVEFIDCTLHVASNGEETLEKWKTGKYDLILMDINMPKMNGFQTTQEIRKLENGKSHTPIMALTASAVVSDHEECLRAGMDDYLIKPITISMFEEKLTEIFTKFQ